MIRAARPTCCLFAGALLLAAADFAQSREGDRSGIAGFQTEIPAYPGNVLLARPTQSSITLSILLNAAAPTRAVVAWGDQPHALTHRTDPFILTPAQPREIVLAGLAPDTRCHYRVLAADDDRPLLPVDAPGSFHTARSPGQPFTFTVQADSHLDESVVLDRYRAALAQTLAAEPDFHIDLGDTFMTGKHDSRDQAVKQYLAQRYWLGLVGHAAPIFLVLGNHDGEAVNHRGYTNGNSLAVWANLQRKSLFPNPIPDAFYTGNAAPHPYAGLLQNYYTFTWGDALFVILDPYWTSTATRGETQPWNATLGREQYDWLADTLRRSTARHKIVFIHQLVACLDPAGRGGAEAARLHEWGGRELDGSNTFATRRPGWPLPIHDLLVATGVQIVFHGHDHFFARQQLDTVAYQLVPQPAHRNSRTHQAADYGYTTGDFLPNAGHLRIHVAPDQLTITYIRSPTGDVAFAYTLPAHAPTSYQ